MELLGANGRRWHFCLFIWFDDNAYFVAESEGTLCSLVAEFGRVCEGIKLRVNVSKSYY